MKLKLFLSGHLNTIKWIISIALVYLLALLGGPNTYNIHTLIFTIFLARVCVWLVFWAFGAQERLMKGIYEEEEK